MFKNILNTQTKSISFASLILASSYVCSAILGLVRDRLLAGKFGASNELDVYYAAFVIPDFIALLLIFGAISAAIIPIFSSYLVKSKDQAWEYANNLLNIFLLCLICVCAVLIIFAPLLINLTAPGFSEAKKAETVMLMRIMFLSPIILGMSNIISGILQVFHRFLATAFAPLFYNAGIIFGIVFFVPWLGLQGLAWGVVLGGVLHLCIQLPSLFYSGFAYKKIFNFKHPGVVRTLKLMIPRSLGLGAGQFNAIVTTAIASTLVTGSVAVFNLANNLSSMLVNTIAVSLSTAIFPSMSLSYSKDDTFSFKRKVTGALRQIMFLIIPASVLIFILRAQIVRVILGTGKFGWIDTRLTAACLGVFTVGLLFQGLIFIFSKTFYAAHNTRIPAIISVATVGFNIALSFLFVGLLQSEGLLFHGLQSWLKLQGIGNISIMGLALAFSVTAIVEALVLWFFVQKKLRIFNAAEIADSCCKIIIATAVMAMAAFFVRQWLVQYHFISLQTFLGVFVQMAASAAAGIACYLVTSLLLQSQEFKIIRESFFKK